MNADLIENFDEILKKRSQELFLAHRQKIYMDTDRLFVGLMLFQWIGGIVIAFTVSPKTWIGAVSQTHIHVWAAIFLGGAIAIFPILLGIYKPGHIITRNVIAVSQMLFSALLIHLTGGRIESHFHVFGSLAFLAFYRDWKVLVPATIIVAIDHMVRGIFWPQSVFGILTVSHWRWVEHAAWVVFEDIFLFRSCLQTVEEMKLNARHMADLELKNNALVARENDLLVKTKGLDQKIQQRTEKLEKSGQELKDLYTDLRAKQSEVLNLYRSTDRMNKKLKETQAQLVQSEKLASLGQLAAGIAHEINNPVGFINNNMEVFQDYAKNLTRAVEFAEKLKKEIENGNLQKAAEIVEEFKRFEKEADLNYIVNDTGKLLDHSMRGLERIQKIVLDLRIFSRQDKGEITETATIESVIDNILGIVFNEVKYKAVLIKDYSETPLLMCNTQRLGQVFINLIVNAAQSMEAKGNITIKTYHNEGFVCVDVSDTGKGIPAENLNKIFDPFYTTKPAGQGTGLGLSVTYEIVKQHGGEISVQSAVGQGTTFTVKIPVKKDA